jgi:hypothetical protein
MSKTFWRGALLAGSLSVGTIMQAQQRFWPPPVDVAVTYVAERAKIAASGCACFWLQGGSVSAAAPIFRGLSAAVNLTGEHSSGIAPGVDLSKVAFMAGPRYTFGTGRGTGRWSDRGFDSRHEISAFGEALFGVAHGFNGVFPISSGIESSANSFSLQVGGGVNVAMTRGFGLRALEIDYVRTSLPNGVGNTQNDLRLGFGVTYRLARNR